MCTNFPSLRPHSPFPIMRAAQRLALGVSAALSLVLSALPASAQGPGVISTVAGNGQGFGSPNGSGGPAAGAIIGGPSDIALGPDGSLYVAAEENHRVWRVGPDGIATIIAGTGNPGFAGDGGPATSAQLRRPRSVAVDGAGNVYIGDGGNNKIRRLDAATKNISTVADTTGHPNFATMDMVLANSDQELLFTDGPQLKSLNVGSGGITVVAGKPLQDNGSVCNDPWDEGASPLVTCPLLTVALALGPDGTIYLSTRGIETVFRITPDRSQMFSVTSGNDETRFDWPYGLAVDAKGTLFIADRYNHRIHKFSGGTLTPVAGSGETGQFNGGFGGDGGPGAEARLNEPKGIAIDGNGNLYIADAVNNRVRKLGQVGFFINWDDTTDTDGDGLRDVWEIYGIDSNRDGKIDLNLPAMEASPTRKDVFIEIDYMKAADHDHMPTAPQLVTVSTDFDFGGQIWLHNMVDEAVPEVLRIQFNPDDGSFDSDGNAIPAGTSFDSIKNGPLLSADPRKYDSKKGTFGTPAERADPNWENIREARRMAFRYCLFAHHQTDWFGSSGKSELPGNDFIVTLGHPLPESKGTFAAPAADIAKTWGTTFQDEWDSMVSATYMHEMGHALGLGHGGGVLMDTATAGCDPRLASYDPKASGHCQFNINCKPNYISVMTYSRQFRRTGIPYGLPSTVGCKLMKEKINGEVREIDICRIRGLIDYSRFKLNDLNETALSEPDGFGYHDTVPYETLIGGASDGFDRIFPVGQNINFDIDGEIDLQSFADINGTNACGANLLQPLLMGHNDWPNIVYNFQDYPKSFADGSQAMSSGTGREQTPKEILNSVLGVSDPDGDEITNVLDNCPADANPGQEDADKDGRGDACDAILTPVFTPGDANLDQSVNVTDAVLVLQHAVGLTVLTGDNFLAANIVEGASVDVQDAVKILRVVVGLP